MKQPKHDSKKRQAMHEPTTQERTEAIIARAKKDAFCCPGCGSHDISSHGFMCMAAVIARARDTNLLEQDLFIRALPELKELVKKLANPLAKWDVLTIANVTAWARTMHRKLRL